MYQYLKKFHTAKNPSRLHFAQFIKFVIALYLYINRWLLQIFYACSYSNTKQKTPLNKHSHKHRQQNHQSTYTITIKVPLPYNQAPNYNILNNIMETWKVIIIIIIIISINNINRNKSSNIKNNYIQIHTLLLQKDYNLGKINYFFIMQSSIYFSNYIIDILRKSFQNFPSLKREFVIEKMNISKSYIKKYQIGIKRQLHKGNPQLKCGGYIKQHSKEKNFPKTIFFWILGVYQFTQL
eukprot:TRINITY_DN150_c0_g1_i12.p1 TRINITY_DN150_c0_g1~~TRINITY_DN150_c0_g1_i12.p1  ORF type:complete len:259 (+),score=-17.13 TRINITY_DN150_c0_g1_i12:64-777(+)